jgi:hypothetical protein
MSDHERGPYAPPSEKPLSFDPRRPVRGAGPVPTTLIISGVILALLVAGVAFLYRGGIRRADQAPAPVGEPLTDIKSPAPPESGGNDVAAGLTIYKTDGAAAANSAAANAAAPTLAPPPEQPLPVIPAAIPPAPPAAAVPPPPPPPAAKPAPNPTLASLEDSAEEARAATKPAKPPISPVEPAATAPGAGWVQIGALSSPALADKAWSDIAHLAPAAMAGKGKRVEPLSRNGKTLYRTYITGFRDHDAAEAFCGKLKAAGKSCLVK